MAAARASSARHATPRTSMGLELGFSLIEVVVAMFVLALMALSLVPLMIGALNLGGVNRRIVSATSLATELISDARREGASGCSALTTWADRTDLAPSTSGLRVDAVATCPADLPGGGRVSVTVHPESDGSRVLAELTTKVLVNA